MKIHDIPTDRDDAPKIEFPCKYPVKVLGEHVDNFEEEVLTVIRRHAPDLDEEEINYRASSNGKYLSIKVTIRATGPEQLQQMFEDLKATGLVSLVI